MHCTVLYHKFTATGFERAEPDWVEPALKPRATLPRNQPFLSLRTRSFLDYERARRTNSYVGKNLKLQELSSLVFSPLLGATSSQSSAQVKRLKIFELAM
jgi:hypothetical protein